MRFKPLKIVVTTILLFVGFIILTPYAFAVDPTPTPDNPILNPDMEESLVVGGDHWWPFNCLNGGQIMNAADAQHGTYSVYVASGAYNISAIADFTETQTVNFWYKSTSLGELNVRVKDTITNSWITAGTFTPVSKNTWTLFNVNIPESYQNNHAELYFSCPMGTSQIDNLTFDYTPNDYYNLITTMATVNKTSVDTTHQINITRPNADGLHASTVDYNIINGTASYGVDMVADAQTGTLSFNASETFKLLNITIKGSSTYTGNRMFTFVISNSTNGVTLGGITTTQITILDPLSYDASGIIVMAQDPVTLFTNATGTLLITDPNNLYDEIDWYNNGKQIRQYKLSGSQWQQWNGTAWINCANSSVFTVSQYQDWAGTSNFYAWIKYNGNVVLGVNKNFEVVQNATQTTYYLRVVDSTGADLSSFNGHFFESEQPNKDYSFTWSGYGAVLDLNRHYQGTVSADGYINGTIAFETTYNNSSSVTYRTITVTLVSSDVPSNPAQAYLDVKIYDSSTNEMVPDAIFTLTNTSGSKTYQIYGTVKRITIEKSASYSWKASSSSYYSMTGTINMTDGQAMLTIPLNPIPAPTATPQPSTGYYTGGDGQATYTPYTDTQRQYQAMTMIDQLLNAGPSLMQLGILAVFMGLVMMLFPDGKKRRYR
jgi:hypothetical protein